MVPLLIRGNLSNPVHITPVYAEGPSGHDGVGCIASSVVPAWEVGGTQFNQRTIQTPQGPTTSMSLAVQLKNNATGYITACGGIFNPSAPWPQPMTCNGQEPYRPREAYRIQTTALYDNTTSTLTVNETWYCDADSAAPYVTLRPKIYRFRAHKSSY